MCAKKINRLILYICLMLGIIIVAGCGKSYNIPTGYFPHENGYKWNYAVNMVSTTEGKTDVYTYYKSRYFDGTSGLDNGQILQILKISGEAINSKKINVCSILNKGGLYLINDSGVFNYGTTGDPTTEATTMLSFPLQSGKTWQRTKGETIEVFGQESISVPAGNFTAWKIGSEPLPDYEYYEWYADGIGLVKLYIRLPVKSPNYNGTISSAEVIGEAIYTEELKSRNF